MKKINLIEWLSRNSHEKQKPQRFGRYAAMLIMLLTLGVGQAWADAFIEAFGLQFYESSTNRYFKTGTDIKNSLAFGNKTSDFKIVYIYANGKKNGGNLCGDVYFKWWLEGTDGASNSGGVGYTSNKWEGDYCYWKFGTENGSTALNGIDLVQNRRPGDYTFKFYYSFKKGDCSQNQWDDCKYSGGDFKFTYTIPDPTITITGASSLVAGTSTNIQASISNYPVGSQITKVRVTGNLASAKETTGSATSLTVSSVTPNASGSNGITVTVTVKFGTGGTKDYVYNYNVLPPAVSDFTITPAGSLAGSGTEGNPYLVTYNGSITFSLSGADDSKAYADANSTAQYSTDGSSYGTASSNTSKTHSSVTQTTNQNWVYRAKLKNKSAALYGAIKEKTVYWKVPTYTVTLDKNSGSAGGSATATHGTTTLTSISAPTKTGYHVEGYYTNDATPVKIATDAGALQGSTAYTDASNKWNSLSNQTLYAHWTANQYIITLNGNGGTGHTSSVKATYNSSTLSASITNPTKTGYTFGGWYSGSGGTGTLVIDASGNLQSGVTISSVAWTNGSSQWVKDGGVTLYAKWTAKKYTITLDNQCAYSDGTHTGGSDTEFEATYDANYFTYYMNTAPSAYLYTFGGWYSEIGGGGDQIITDLGSLVTGTTVYTTSGNWTYDGNPTVYAKWSVGLTTGLSDGIVANGGSGGAITLTYNSSATSGFTPSTRTGYILDGYYTAATDGDKVINANGTIVAGTVSGYVSSGKWVYNSSATLKIYAQWTPITYTIAFAKNTDASYEGSDVGTDPDNIAATYDVNATMPANPYTRTGYHFIGWATAAHKAKGSTPAYDYAAGSTQRNLTTTNGATVTLYPKWEGDSKTVTFNPRGGDTPYPSSTSVRYGETYGTGTGLISSDLPTPTRSGGYEFAGWYTAAAGGTLVTKDTKMLSTADHTLYAHWTKVNRVYFKDNLGWNDVYVTYDAYWKDKSEGSGEGAGNNGKIYHHMTHIAGTDIWYDDIPAACISSWKYNIAFNSQQLGTVGESSNYNHFDKGEAIFRVDFDSIAPLFVPTNNKNNNVEGNYTKNSTQYRSTGYTGDSGDPVYTSGYWRTYDDVFSGYTITWDNGGWIPAKKFNGPTSKDSIFAYTMSLAANTTYNYNIIKKYGSNGKSDEWKYGSTITSADCTEKKLICQNGNGSMQTTVAGDYTFILALKADGHIYLTIEYPFAVGDYKVVSGWTDGSAKTFDSEYIHAKASTKDTISVFVHYGKSPSLTIQKCTAINGSGVATWEDLESGASIDLSAIEESGVYNFEIAQPASGDPTGSFVEKYEGDYYIRTECADGGWDMYKYRAGNIMTLSEYSLTQTLSAPYSHYFCKYIGGTAVPISTDITFTVATKYSPAICETMIGDATIGGVANKTLPAGNPASVRFFWNEETNATGRSYLKAAQYDEGDPTKNQRYLVLHGKSDDMIYDENGDEIAANASIDLAKNELLFVDQENWIYSLKLQAKPGAQISLIANYNGSDRYLIGAVDAWETIIGGTSDTQYEISAVYDFKTNRLMTAWKPTGAIADQINDVDVLIERKYQGGGTTITFNKKGDNDPGSIDAQRVIGALKFDYNDLVGHVASWTPASRAMLMYFISFPFDVNVSDIFGLNTNYGEAFVVRKYNGALRAEKGFFGGDGTETFWEDLPIDSVMHAYEGYCVIMDNEYMNGDVGNVWDYKVAGSSVYLYFPSATKDFGVINSDAKSFTIPAHECKIDRTFSAGKLNHKYTDSNWNVMGVPIFQNHTGTSTAGTPGAIFTPTSIPTDTTDYIDNPDLGYFYKWDTDKSYTVTSAVGFTFKPMHSYLVQYAGTVKFTCAAPTPVEVAARRAPMAENYKMELQVLNSNDEMLNRTYVELREFGIDSFALNEDLFMVTNKHAVNVYTYAGTHDVSANVLSIGNHVVPMGVIVKQAGTYTFTMPSNFSGTVTLIDTQEGTRTNLALSDYIVTLQKGTFNERFFLEIDLNQAPTAIDGVGDGTLKDGNAHKFIMNGMMYILKDGVIYDARGNRVQ